MSDIINEVIAYLEFQKETFGNNLLLELPDKPIHVPATVVNPVINSFQQAPEVKFERPVKEVPIEHTANQSIASDWNSSLTLIELNEKIHTCLECPLGSTRKSFVFGSGNPDADILVIGEAPGADEDEQGLPFVGRAGQLLTKILESIKLSREEVYIANIVKCRPPNNRRPEKNEVDQCERYLKKQIDIIKPAFILSLGLTSVDTLLKKTHKMADIRGKITDYHGIKMFVTYHPAALLRNPQWKKLVWEDVQLFRKMYDEYLLSKGG